VSINQFVLFYFKSNETLEYVHASYPLSSFIHTLLFVSADDLERYISALESEMGVHVERFDIVRDRMARNLYEHIHASAVAPQQHEQIDPSKTLSPQQQQARQRKAKQKRASLAPLLYHRESRQVVSSSFKNRNKIRAWAKGRLLLREDFDLQESGLTSTPTSEEGESGFVPEEDDEMIDQEEEYTMEQDLTVRLCSSLSDFSLSFARTSSFHLFNYFFPFLSSNRNCNSAGWI